MTFVSKTLQYSFCLQSLFQQNKMNVLFREIARLIDRNSYSCRINQKPAFLALQTDIVSKYNFPSSNVKPYLSPLFHLFEHH